MSRPRFGYLRVLVMLKREGWQVGKNRVYRLCRLEGLQLRMKVKRRKRLALLRGKPPIPNGPNQHWSMAVLNCLVSGGTSAAPSTQRMMCPRNRVNSTRRLRRPLRSRPL
ncbi:IS3 family transposase [Variovorax dokdonensis]|uniref:IS3 family transposase n=1 Tax=Variovorax dokdonensis TaxID=344883 RepID=UPI0034A1E9F7